MSVVACEVDAAPEACRLGWLERSLHACLAPVRALVRAVEEAAEEREVGRRVAAARERRRVAPEELEGSEEEASEGLRRRSWRGWRPMTRSRRSCWTR